MSIHAPTVLLDLDGTLINSQPGIKASCLNALRSLGYKPDSSLDVSALIGPPLEDIMRVLLQPYGDDRVIEAVEAYRTDYGESGLFQSIPYPGIAETLAELQQSGAHLYLATSKRRKFALRILNHLNFSDHFDGIYGSEDDGSFDHKPELIANIVQKHSLSANDCIMVGDRKYDIIGAQANNMRALGVLWGYGSRDELETAGADDFVVQPNDLPTAALKTIASSRN
ncbi:MAG: HAD hydrolase-like protein [Parasphingorhabdus sp.]